MGDGRRQRKEAIMGRKYCVAPKCYDNRLFFHGQHRRFCLPRAGWEVGDRGPLLPFGNGLLVDPVAFSQHPQALLTMLYRSTDRLCRRGAPMKNLAHSASFDSEDKDAPPKPWIKHTLIAALLKQRATNQHRHASSCSRHPAGVRSAQRKRPEATSLLSC